MPHPESEHGLRVQLATALRERDDFKALNERSLERLYEAQEALAAANARADAAEFGASVLPAEAQHAISELTEALAAARRESTLYRGVIDNLLSVMEMQEKRESGAFHITGEVMFGIWSDAKSEARKALAAPASAADNEAHGDGTHK